VFWFGRVNDKSRVMALTNVGKQKDENIKKSTLKNILFEKFINKNEMTEKEKESYISFLERLISSELNYMFFTTLLS